jgi:hypothetical protein
VLSIDLMRSGASTVSNQDQTIARIRSTTPRTTNVLPIPAKGIAAT